MVVGDLNCVRGVPEVPEDKISLNFPFLVITPVVVTRSEASLLLSLSELGLRTHSKPALSLSLLPPLDFHSVMAVL
jgi:hypothetical protein